MEQLENYTGGRQSQNSYNRQDIYMANRCPLNSNVLPQISHEVLL